MNRVVVIIILVNVTNKWLCCVLFGSRDPDTSSMTQGQSAPGTEKETKPWQHRDLSDIKQRVESWSHLWNGTVIISKWSLKYLNKIISVSFQGPYECYLSMIFVNNSSPKVEFAKESQDFNDGHILATENSYHSLNLFIAKVQALWA